MESSMVEMIVCVESLCKFLNKDDMIHFFTETVYKEASNPLRTKGHLEVQIIVDGVGLNKLEQPFGIERAALNRLFGIVSPDMQLCSSQVVLSWPTLPLTLRRVC
ncbi:unnamed protein product [Haemonchus placei]|uniref:HATPase_c domain-containing protein n=1 Tax=Haemonchus placei TaxID=6290 RepID=A0A0N4WL91_HAEPC|nr:unnamed protein product [Haemonchus placei]